jgi:hypothetical protein
MSTSTPDRGWDKRIYSLSFDLIQSPQNRSSMHHSKIKIQPGCRAAQFSKMVINKRITRRAPHPKELIMAVSVDLSNVLDEAYEEKSLKEILAAPPSALAGLTERHNRMLAEVFGIRTVAELGSNKYFALAGALVAIANKI